MSLLAYAIAEQGAGMIDGVGLDERPLVRIGHEGLALVVSQHEYPLPEPTAKMLWRYEEVVERLMGSQPILPARFGSVLADEEEAVTALRARHDELRRALTRVRGALEMGVRATWTQPPTRPRAGTGTEYLLSQLDVRRRAKRCADSVSLGRETTSFTMPLLPCLAGSCRPATVRSQRPRAPRSQTSIAGRPSPRGIWSRSRARSGTRR